jgi:LAT3 family solute carrier family 43 protein 3
MANETDALLAKSSVTTTTDGASPLSNSLRWTTNVLALTATFFFSGIIFGWAPLELILLREGQYGGLCTGQSGGVGINTAFEADADLTLLATGAPLCSEQTNSLAGMFTIGQFFLNFFSFFVGMALDYLPKSILLSMCAVLEIVGLVLLGLSETTGDVQRDYFYISYSLLAIGGSATMLSAFPASFLLKSYQAALLASISCLFDASSIIFYFVKMLQDKLGWERKEMLFMYTFWAVLVYVPLIFCWTILEKRNWEQVLEEEDAAEEVAAKNRDLDGTVSTLSDDYLPSNDPNFLAHVKRIQNMTIFAQMKTTDFAFTMFFVAAHMLQCNYYVMAVDAFLLSLGDDDAKYASIFSWALPCGIFFVPFIERTVTYLGVVNTLHATNVLGLIFAVTLLVPNLSVQTVNFFVFTGFRAYLYATINTLIATTFGVQTMGRIIGVTFTTAAIVGLVQYPMAVVSEVYFEGDYTPMNALLVGVAILPALVTFKYGSYITAVTSYDNDVESPTIHAFGRKALSARNPGLILASPGRELVHSIRKARRHHDDLDAETSLSIPAL